VSAFFVHWVPLRGRVRIHTAQCSAYKISARFRNLPSLQIETPSDWISADTYSEARRIVNDLRLSKPILINQRSAVDCGLCTPGKHPEKR
jgi:hypothetical protein